MATILEPVVQYIRKVAGQHATRHLTDADLVERFAARRDEAAFTALLRRHGRLVLGVCRRVLRHEQDAEDSFQATFVLLAHKVGSIRKGQSIASWLYGVAYRMAMNAKRKAARRRACEKEAPSPLPLSPEWRGESPVAHASLRELQAILDEEVNRLPESYRAPFVLCCLEGKSRSEAAEELGWKEGTVASRLAHARARLQKRLVRRGITLSAALAAGAIVQESVMAAVPPGLASATIQAALLSTGKIAAGAIPASVATLVNGMSKAMAFAKFKLGMGVFLAVSVVAGSAGLVGPGLVGGERPNEQAPRNPVSPRNRVSLAAATPKIQNQETHAVRGRVLGPYGKPIAGAKVYVVSNEYNDKTVPSVRATTWQNGEFSVKLTQSEVDAQMTIVAAADGHGPDWIELKSLDKENEVTLRLVKDDVPIEGRILDLQGRPVAGVKIAVHRLSKMPSGDLTPWLKERRAKTDRMEAGIAVIKYQDIMKHLFTVAGIRKATVTDPDGRFRLTGLGRERLVGLRTDGPTIEHQHVEVMTRHGPSGIRPRGGSYTYGADFEHFAAPSKPFVGTVRDKKTRKPVAGAFVVCQGVTADGPSNGVHTTTDEQGRFRLMGAAKSAKYYLNVGKVPYISPSHPDVADTPGLDPITVDFELEKALAFRGRVLDKDTGKPVAAYVQYWVLGDNPSLNQFPSYPRNVFSSIHTEKDGSFTLTVLPGPGLISIEARDNRFTRAKAPKGVKVQDGIIFNLVPGMTFLDSHHVVVPINPSEKDPQSLSRDMQLDPGQKREGQVVGPDGQPLPGATIAGLTAVATRNMTGRESVRLDTSAFTMSGIDPEQPRMLVLLHEAKKLGNAVLVRGKEEGPLTVRLQSLGAITGRVVDAAGKPRSGLTIQVYVDNSLRPVLPSELRIGGIGTLFKILNDRKAKTDKDGKFRIEGTVPGLQYKLAVAEGEQFLGKIADKLPIKPGETHDLGDIQVKPDD